MPPRGRSRARRPARKARQSGDLSWFSLALLRFTGCTGCRRESAACICGSTWKVDQNRAITGKLPRGAQGGRCPCGSGRLRGHNGCKGQGGASRRR